MFVFALAVIVIALPFLDTVKERLSLPATLLNVTVSEKFTPAYTVVLPASIRKR